MATHWEVDVEHEGRGVELAYREQSAQDWTLVGERPGSRFRVSVNAAGVFQLRARPVGTDGRPQADKQKVLTLDPGGPVTDRPDPTTLSVPETEVAQEGSAFLITQRGPLGQPAAEYRWECRHSLTAVDPEDAKQVGIFDIGETAREDAWSGLGTVTQSIHVRLIRRADGVCGAWQSVDILPKDATEADAEDHSTDFAGGTIVPICEDGPEPLEVDAGNILMRSDVSLDDFAAATLDSLEFVSLDRVAGTPIEGTYQTPTISLPDRQAFAIEFRPVVDAISRPDPSLDDLAFDPLGIPDVDLATDDPHDNEVDRMSATLDREQEPVRAELSVATSTANDPPSEWLEADFHPHVPGRVHVAKHYACRVRNRSRFGLVVEFSSYRIRRERVCRRCDARLVQIRVEQAAHGFDVGDVVRWNGTAWEGAQADAAGNLAAGIVSIDVDAATFFVALSGVVVWPAHGLTSGTIYYLDPVTPGALTTTRPSGGDFAQAVLVPISDDEVLVNIGQGEETA